MALYGKEYFSISGIVNNIKVNNSGKELDLKFNLIRHNKINCKILNSALLYCPIFGIIILI